MYTHIHTCTTPHTQHIPHMFKYMVLCVFLKLFIVHADVHGTTDFESIPLLERNNTYMYIYMYSYSRNATVNTEFSHRQLQFIYSVNDSWNCCRHL